MIIQTKGRGTVKVKDQLKQKVGSLKAVQTIDRMLMHRKHSKQKVDSLKAVQTRGRMLM